MDFQPQPCPACTGEGGEGRREGREGDFLGCCSPSIAAASWCDGDQVITVLIASPCAECGTGAGDPAVVGWFGPGGGYSPGAPPAGAEPCVGSVQVDQECASVTTVVLCVVDPAGCTRFLRHYVHDCDGNVTGSTDTDLAGQPLTSTGDVSDCSACVDEEQSPPEPCAPTPMCARLAGISGPDEWTMPAGAESVNLAIVCGPITVIDCAGEQTVINEGCGSLSWAAPGTTCAPGELCQPFRIEIPDGSAVYVNWAEPCGGNP